MLSKWRAILIFFIFQIPAGLYAESEIKVFQTRQPGEALISTIAPLYGNSVKLTAFNNSLIVKAPNHLLIEIEQLLKEIDKPMRNLLIEVASSQEDIENYQQDSIEGRIKIGDDGEISSRSPEQGSPNTSIRYRKNGSVIKTTHTRRNNSRNNPEHFKVRAMEGNWSYIQVGQKVPYYNYDNSASYNRGSYNQHRPWQSSVELVDVTSGFDVYPTLNNDQVTLKVRPHNRSMDREHPGRINTRSIDTIVTGKLGQWIYLGGAINQLNEQTSGSVYSTKRRSKMDSNYRIKVNIID